MAEIKTQKPDNFKHFIRIANTDLDGNKSLERSLTKIKGIGFQYSHAICSILKLNGMQKTGYMEDSEIKKIEEFLKNPLKYNIPSWMLNRRNDAETGLDGHLLTSDLDFVQSNDIKMMKKIKSYKGIRHMKGQPVRGQRTKSHFRVNKGKGMGVKKNAPVAKKSPATKSDKK